MKNDSMKIKRGTKVKNRYEILEILGTGGFGNTYKAIDHLVNRFVAIKCSEYSLSHETKILKALENVPYISHQYDYFVENQYEYLVMRLIQGKSMTVIMKENGGILNYRMLKQILPSVFITLEQMHDRGIIHRDISPGNFVMTDEKTLYLIDFGAATSVKETKLKNHQIFRHRGLESPEYANASRQGPWTDIYSLCITIIYFLSGEAIPEAKDRKQFDPVPSILARLSLPAKAQNALLRGLSLDEKYRYESMQNFAEDFLGAEKMVSLESEYSVHYHAKTFIGARDINQDNFMIDTHFAYAGEDCEIKGYINCRSDEYHVVAVADGVGSSMHAELASKAAIQAVSHFIDYHRYDDGLANNLMEELLNQINEKIISLAKKIGKTATTVAIMLWKNDNYCVANIGDSPIYQLSGRKMQCLSYEHTIAKERLEKGQKVQAGDFYKLSSYLGKANIAGSEMAYVKTGKIQKGDIFLLCTDGVSRNIDEKQKVRYIKKDGDKAMRKIYRKINKNARLDNCTTIILKF